MLLSNALELDPVTLQLAMSKPMEEFEHLGTVHEVERVGKKRKHIHIQRGSKVLGVAHMDSVRKASRFWMNDEFIASPTLDDRIGLWLLLWGLPSMGIVTDVLLTDDEESGNSTGKDFKLPEGVSYNWMFMFDRTGTDTACYQYLDKEWKETLAAYDLEAVDGMNSCIGYMGELGCKGMNLGVGYYDYHGDSAYLIIKHMRKQVYRFAAFYEAHKETEFKHTGRKTRWFHQPYTPPARWVQANGVWQRENEAPKETQEEAPVDSRDDLEWEDEWLWGYGYGYGRRGNMRQLKKIQDEIKTEGEGKDKKRAERIIARLEKKGKRDPFFDGKSPTAWWFDNGITWEEAVGVPHNRRLCAKCFSHFRYDHVIWSESFARTYCRPCYMEQLQEAGIINSDWRWLANSLPLERGGRISA